MTVEAALVSFNVKGTPHFYKASGVLFDENFVLTSGMVLTPLLHDLRKEDLISSCLKSISPTLETNEWIQNVSFEVLKERKNDGDTKKANHEKLLPVESEVVGVWKCPLVTHTLETWFCDWSLERIIDQEKSGLTNTSKELMSTFILLKCKEEGDVDRTNKSENHINAFFNLVLNLAEPDRGQEVEIISTPFGNEILFNSLSRGIISTVIGNEKCCILTDARTVSGSEGGPIFSTDKFSGKEMEKGRLIGLVTCPLTSWRGEWIGLTVGISLLPVLKRFLQLENDSVGRINAFSNRTSGSSLLDIIDETVVLIRSESSWGSGVVLNAALGIITTCSHIFRNDQDVSVFCKKNLYPAKILFRSKNNTPYDLAVIQTTRNIFKKEINFYEGTPKLGDAVIAAGFPLFSERDDFNLQPSVVGGCVAQVNPFMIQTTCCIQSGFSGGALLKNGKLLGIIVCNIRNSTANALFPHVNFAIPSSVFRDSISHYIKTKDVRWLESLEVLDPEIHLLWKFQISKL